MLYSLSKTSYFHIICKTCTPGCTCNSKVGVLTQEVAMHVPQSLYVSTVMLDKAVRSNGQRSSQSFSTCSEDKICLFRDKTSIQPVWAQVLLSFQTMENQVVLEAAVVRYLWKEINTVRGKISGIIFILLTECLEILWTTYALFSWWSKYSCIRDCTRFTFGRAAVPRGI